MSELAHPRAMRTLASTVSTGFARLEKNCVDRPVWLDASVRKRVVVGIAKAIASSPTSPITAYLPKTRGLRV